MSSFSLSTALLALTLAGPFFASLGAAENARPPRVKAAWGGEASLRAHREARQQAAIQRAGGETARAPRAGSGPSTASSSSPSSSSPGSGPSTPIAPPAPPPPVATPTLTEIAAMRQGALLRQREEEQRIARERPLRVAWPASPQASLHWRTKPLTVDGLDVSHSEVRTPRHTLLAQALVDYFPVAKLEDSPRYGLVLAHRVRPDLRIECYTFPARSFLPDLEIRSVKAYQSCLQETFEGGAIELLDPSRSFREYGPAILDQATRVVRFRHLPEPAQDRPQPGPREFVDYLIPLPGELLVVRFSAPVALFDSAQGTVENFLIELQQAETRTTTVAR